MSKRHKHLRASIRSGRLTNAVNLADLPNGITALLPQGKRTGRPNLKDNPHIIGVVGKVLANGGTQREAAEAAGISGPTASRLASDHAERIDAMRKSVQRIVLQNVLKDAEKATQAQMEHACEKDKSSPQAFRVAMEAAGVIGRQNSIYVGGDVNVQAFTLDQSQHVHARDDAGLDGILDRYGAS